jgi:GT2 family glycosyltransferase
MQSKKISIVIVNYNVKDFLHKCLETIEIASGELTVETIVVDNNSSDGSLDYLKPKFPNVDFISLEENIGFGRANNIGFEKASGDYILVLNPDTEIKGNTLSHMLEYMESNKQVGISGCKVLNTDGTFQLACRRGFPTPWNSFAKLFGLGKIFPNSKLFSGYNLSYKSVDETYPVDALIGAFMFIRREALEGITGFDPDFFMYGEDLDLCYRIQQKGWRVDYVHTAEITHHKGESTKRSTINEIKHFYEAMEIFAQKHYKHYGIFSLFLKTGIKARSLLSYANKYKIDLFFIIFDILVFSLCFIISNKIRFGYWEGYPKENLYLFLILINSFLLISQFFSGQYFEDNPSVRKNIISSVATFFLAGFLTYLINGFDLSRKVLLLATFMYLIPASILRFSLSRKFYSIGKKRSILLFGDKQINISIKHYLENQRSNLFDNISIISGHDISDLISSIKMQDFTEIVITDEHLSTKDIEKELRQIVSKLPEIYKANTKDEFITQQILRDTIDHNLIAKSPFVFLRVRFVKRLFDICFSIFLLTFGSPFLYLLKEKINISFKDLKDVLSGHKSLVGVFPVEQKRYFSKAGITSLAPISNTEQSELSVENTHRLNEFYDNNFSFSLDAEIIIKSFFRK